MKLGISFAVVCLVTATVFGSMIITVTPDGDGSTGKDRYGWGFPWENVGYSSGANPNWCGHWYDSPYGSSRDIYMQLAISGITSAEQISGATLYINISQITGSGCNLYHASNAASATGNASDLIGGNEYVTNIASGTGWVGFDVTQFIKNDVQNGYHWSAFQFANIGYSGVTFGSGDNADVAPYLLVIPEPATMLVLGLGGLVLSRRK